MKIYNKTNQRLITDQAKLATSFLDRFLGLLNPHNSRALIFQTRFGLHTFGLKKPIDILLLDDQGVVVQKEASFAPNQFYFYSPIYKTVIELPAGSLLQSQTKLNDKIIFA